MPKTPEYTKRAIDKYRTKYDFVQLRLPKGAKEVLIQKAKMEGSNLNDHICGLVLDDLEGWDGKKTSEDIGG